MRICDVVHMDGVVPVSSRVNGTGGNWAGSAGSWWYRSSSHLQTVPTKLGSRLTAGFTGKPGRFFLRGNRSNCGSVSPGVNEQAQATQLSLNRYRTGVPLVTEHMVSG
jgi:hypothetical protein